MTAYIRKNIAKEITVMKKIKGSPDLERRPSVSAKTSACFDACSTGGTV